MKDKQLDKPLYVSLGLNLLLLIVLLGITIEWRRRRGNDPCETEQTLCEPCASLTTDGKVPTGCWRNETDTGRCCCKASIVINTIVKRTAKEKFSDYNSRETGRVMQFESDCGIKQRVSGKVSGIDYDSLKKDTRERDLIYWEKSEHSILDFVRYTNGRFTINEPGYYYVFSQLKYEHDPESRQDTAARQTHALHHYSLRTRESKLLENSRSFSELHLEENNGTSFFGAVFRFERNDKIMIKSSHTHRISGADQENFFGLHML